MKTIKKAAVYLSVTAAFMFQLSVYAQQATPMVDATDKQSGTEWLLTMADAIAGKNYQVSMVVNRPGLDTVPYMWRHGVFDDGVNMEQLSILNGPGKEFIRVNRVISVFEPDEAPYSLYGDVIDGPFPGQLLTSPLELQKGYDFIAVGRGRISGRAAQQIRIVSKDNSRFAYQLWIDEDSGMPLKMNMLEQNGQLLKQIQVTQMSLSEQPDEYFARINHDMLPEVTGVPARHHQHNWQLAYIPVGMSEIKRNTHRLQVTGQVVEYAMLSDGLVDVSVYVMPSANTQLQNHVYKHESKSVLTRTDGKLLVSVVGEIPPQTANKIAMSLSPRIE
ncbi:MucB/RseB C-terminal domain-containing protein [Alteromonas facilis]|uniref:MucB/RseB C-terminal domain-containing protein n=1 Tax=Alteromonas facilis TaxID=2048004 RepID=UPI0013DB15BE|nr:MucB/RseB C-terminal domain-containing protein [Alteromonas facilis]